MVNIDIINNFIKTFCICIYIFVIYFKLIDYKNIKKHQIFICLIYSFLIAFMYAFIEKYLNSTILYGVILLGYGIILTIITTGKFINSMTAVIISFIISYVFHLFSIFCAGILVYFLKLNISKYNPLINIFIVPIEVLLISIVFILRRLNKGLYFLKNPKDIKDIYKYIIVFGSLILIICGIIKNSRDEVVVTCLLIFSAIIFIRFVSWIKFQITKTYKTKMRDRTIELQKTEIDEKNKKIEEIKTENLKLATAIHKYNHKFEALELAMKNALNLESKEEFTNELSVILKEVGGTSKNFAKATEVTRNKLPETNIPGIDNMFKYMQEEATKNNINFDLKINTSINPLINNIISKEKFEILIGDHLKDAIIAVNLSEKSYKSILVILGLVDGVYEFSVYDTGIEFEIDTLLKLGKEQVTTHKETGGSGIGFMTTFETLKECKASLVIEEYNPETTSYTKSVTIRFDGKNKYKICSYRAEKIKEQKNKRRIIIQKLK